jgi:hypothetical protein
VPSPEEIREILEAKRRGVPIQQQENMFAVKQKCSDLTTRVAKLQDQLADTKVGNRAMRITLDHVLEKHGVEPAEELIRIAQATTPEGHYLASLELRKSIWAELLAYRMPRLRSTEVSGTVDHSMTIKVVQFSKDGGEKLIEERVIDVEASDAEASGG